MGKSLRAGMIQLPGNISRVAHSLSVPQNYRALDHCPPRNAFNAHKNISLCNIADFDSRS